MLHYTAEMTSQGIKVTLDPQLYLAPKEINLAGTQYHPGFFLNAELKVLAFDALAKVSVDKTRGISADGKLSKVIIGTEALFSLEDTTGKSGPSLSISTFEQPDQPEPFKSPHAMLDGKVTLLGLSRSLYVSISSSGFAFDMKGTYFPGIDYDFQGGFTGLTDMSIGGALKVGIGKIDLGPLGTVDVGSYVSLGADLGVKGSAIWARFPMTFSFMGDSHSTTLALDTTTGALSQLPGKAVDAIIAILKKLFEDALTWARAVASGLIEGIKDIEKALLEVFHLPQAAADAILATIQAIGGSCGMTTALLAA